MNRKESTTLFSKAVRQCTEGLPLPTTPRRRGRVLKECYCPLLQGSEAVNSSGSATHCTKAVRQCVEGAPAHCPNVERQCT